MSRIFQPFRAVGVVSGDVPFSFNSLGSENFVTVPVGNSFHVYNCSDLRLSLVSSLIDRPITSVCNVNETTFTACGSSLLVWYRAHIVQRLDGEHGANITSLLSFGPTVVSISAKDSRVCVWNVVARDGSNVELVTTFRLDRGYSKNNDISSSDDGSSSNNSNNSDESSNSDSDSDSDSNSVKCSSSFRERPFYVTAALHPATYINKIVLGSSSGELELWNVATRTKIHTMQCVSSNIIRGSVTALAQSPAADVIGVGYSSGEILIINLAYDEILMRFNQREGLGCVTSLSFRTDSSITSTSGTNTARLVSTGETGSFAIWDLEHKRLESIYNNAHDGRIVSATFMPREPLLLTSGEDNSLRMFIFDQPDGSARQLKSRVGHWLPPTQIRFYGGEVLSTLGDGADGAALQILSSGKF
jgi:U3 small nucleolar RNA-associated protein 21